MLKQTISYTNMFDTNTETNDFYFNLTEFEVVEINLMEDLASVGKSKDPRRVIPTFKRIVRAAVGQRIGEQFIKTEEFANAFIASNAYSQLFKTILGGENSEEKMTAFVQGIIPADMNVAQDALPVEAAKK